MVAQYELNITRSIIGLLRRKKRPLIAKFFTITVCTVLFFNILTMFPEFCAKVQGYWICSSFKDAK